jgi:HK97 gp10 family phage protein
MKFHVSTTGVKEIDAALKAMTLTLTHKTLGSAHLAAAQPLIKREAQLAPIREGDLSASIGGVKTPISKANAIGEVVVGPRRTRQHRGFHGHLVEKGTRRRTNKKGANRGVMPAQPFAEPAFQQTHAQVEQNIAQEVGKSVWRTMKRFIK